MKDNPLEIELAYRKRFEAADEAVNVAKKQRDDLLDEAVEASKPNWTLEVVAVVAEFKSRPTYVTSKRTHGRTTEEEREEIYNYSVNGIPAQDVAKKFAVSLPTVYQYGSFGWHNRFAWSDGLRYEEYKFKTNLGNKLMIE